MSAIAITPSYSHRVIPACYFCEEWNPESEVWCHGFDRKTDPYTGGFDGPLHRFLACERCNRLVEADDRERILWVVRSEVARKDKEQRRHFSRWRNPEDVYRESVRDGMYGGDSSKFVRTSGIELAMRRFSAATGLLGPEAPYVTYVLDGAHRVYVEVMPTHARFNFRVSEWPDGPQPVDVIEDRERCTVTFHDGSEATYDLDAELERWKGEHSGSFADD